MRPGQFLVDCVRSLYTFYFQPNTMPDWKYLLCVTLFVFFVPGLFVSTPFLLLFCLLPTIVVAAPLLLIILLFCPWFFYKIAQFLIWAKEGSLPTNFFVRYFPFFFPFFFDAIIVIVGYGLMPKSIDHLVTIAIYSHPFYLASLTALAATYFSHMTVIAFPMFVSGIVAIVAPIYLERKIPNKVTNRSFGTITYIVIFAILTGTAIVQYYDIRNRLLLSHTRENIVIPDEIVAPISWYRNVQIVIGEYDYHYSPFDDRNKLITIESPTLAISSDYPEIGGLRILYPLYATAIQAVYQGLDAKSVKDYYCIGTSNFGDYNGRRYNTDKLDIVFELEENENSVTVGYDAFVFYVNKNNPVNNLTLQQIREIYTGKITHWNAVGGQYGRILPFQRESYYFSYDIMANDVMQGQPLASPLEEECLIRGIFCGLTHKPAVFRNERNAIGYSMRYLPTQLFADVQVKLLSIDGIAPTNENIQSGKYPFVKKITMTANGDNPHAKELIDWFLSPQGQSLVEKVGFVPLK